MPNSCHALTRLDLILGRTDGENFGRAPSMVVQWKEGWPELLKLHVFVNIRIKFWTRSSQRHL